MDLTTAKALLAGAVAAAPRPAQRFVWGRWDGTHVYLDDDPETPLVADNAAGWRLPGQRVLCLLDGRRITVLGPPAAAAAGSSGRGSWWRSPDGLQVCWVRTTSVRAATAPYGALHQGRWQWDFPQPFVSTPAVTCSQWQWTTGASWGTISGDTSTHSALLRGLDVVPRTVADPLVICATAIGRWRS